MRAAGIEVEFLDRAHGGVRKIKIGRCGDDCKNDNVTTKPEGSDPDGQQKREEKRPIVTIVTKKPASGDDGDDGDDGFLTSTLDEDIEKRERGGREGGKIEGGEREGKVTKSPSPPSPSSPDAGFLVTIGDDGDDSEELAGEIPDPDDYQSIAENLEEDRRRQAEEAERTATPPPKSERVQLKKDGEYSPPKKDDKLRQVDGEPEEDRAPTIEEAEVLADVAGRILQNWPGIAEARLWELAREKLGSPLPLAVVKAWLKESGYTEAGRLNGSPLWNPPVGVIS